MKGGIRTGVRGKKSGKKWNFQRRETSRRENIEILPSARSYNLAEGLFKKRDCKKRGKKIRGFLRASIKKASYEGDRRGVKNFLTQTTKGGAILMGR